MKRFSKKIKGQAKKARANLDRALLNIKTTIEKTGGGLAKENELAWSIANKVLEKVKKIRKTLSTKPRAAATSAVVRPVRKKKKVKKVKTRRKARARS